MSSSVTRSSVERASALVEVARKRLPAPLYVSLFGIVIVLTGPIVEALGHPIIGAMVGAYGIIAILWGILAWFVVLGISQLDTYRR